MKIVLKDGAEIECLEVYLLPDKIAYLTTDPRTKKHNCYHELSFHELGSIVCCPVYEERKSEAKE